MGHEFRWVRRGRDQRFNQLSLRVFIFLHRGFTAAPADPPAVNLHIDLNNFSACPGWRSWQNLDQPALKRKDASIRFLFSEMDFDFPIDLETIDPSFQVASCGVIEITFTH